MPLYGRSERIVSGTGSGVRPLRQGEYLPLALVVLALLAIVLVPIALRRETAALRDEIEMAAEPARTYVTEIQYLLARETSTLRGYVITGDSAFLTQFRQLAQEEAQAIAELEPLARTLGGQPLSVFVELRTLTTQWHQRLREEMAAPVRRPGTTASVPFEQGLYLQALEAGNRLDEALLQASQLRRAEIRRVERRMMLVNAVLVLLALSAALSVGWLGDQARRLGREAEERRREAERALDETARAMESRAKLIRGITHDVKNPLGVADGYADLLELGFKGELTPAQREVMAKIRSSIRDALDIIGDLLELSRAEAGGLRLDLRPLDLRGLLEDVVEGYRGAAHGTGHRLVAALPAEPVELETDPGRVRQVLGNLLTNALKHTPSGSLVHVRLVADAEWVSVRVEDSGPGIPPEERELVFAEFHRLAGSRGAGHGLGLAISRRIARLLHGDLLLESEPGRGATFILRLPRTPPLG